MQGRMLRLRVSVFLLSYCYPHLTSPRDKTTGKGVCGLGPDFCGKGCISNCERKSECDPGWGIDWSESAKCPLNVCCSKFGFCGTTADFCGSSTVISPECPGGSSAKAKTIGYYEAWNLERPCGSMSPQYLFRIVVGKLT